MVYNNDGGVNERTEYDSVGNLIKYTMYNSDGAVGILRECTYDSAGNRLSEYYESHTWEYDDEGNETPIVRMGNYKYIYDSADNLIRMEQYWNHGVTYLEEYDSNGNLIYSCENSDDGKLESRYEYQFDDKGRIVEKRTSGNKRLERERQTLLEIVYGGNWLSDGTLWEGQTALYFRWTCLPDCAVPELAADYRRNGRRLS